MYISSLFKTTFVRRAAAAAAANEHNKMYNTSESDIDIEEFESHPGSRKVSSWLSFVLIPIRLIFR